MVIAMIDVINIGTWFWNVVIGVFVGGCVFVFGLDMIVIIMMSVGGIRVFFIFSFGVVLTVYVIRIIMPPV